MAVNISVGFLIFIAIAAAIFGLVSSSIAIQAYNENQNYNPYGNPDMRKNNFIYLWVNIALSVLALVTIGFVIYSGGANCKDYGIRQ